MGLIEGKSRPAQFLIFPSGMFSLSSDGRYVEYGNGHVVRCVNIAREILRRDPDSQVTLGVSGPEATFASKLLAGIKGFSVVKVPEVANSLPHWKFDYRLSFETNLIRFLEPSVVICDTHAEGLIAAKHNGRKSVSILDLPPIEFYHIYSMLADLVLIPLTSSTYTLPSPLASTSHFVGPILDEESIDSVNSLTDADLRKEIGVERPFLLAYLSRIHSDRPKLLSVLLQAHRDVQERGHKDLALVMIGPGAEQETARAAREGSSNSPSPGDVIALDYVANVHKYIKASSAFLTRSPIIAMEGLALGKKAILVPIPEDRNQSSMAQSLGERAVYAPLESLDASRLAKLVEDALAEHPMGTGTDERAFAHARSGGATARAVQMILDLARVSA